MNILKKFTGKTACVLGIGLVTIVSAILTSKKEKYEREEMKNEIIDELYVKMKEEDEEDEEDEEA